MHLEDGMSVDNPETLKELSSSLLSINDAAIRSLEMECELLRRRNKELASKIEQLERTAKVLAEALVSSLVAFNAFWPTEPPENEIEADEDRAIQRVRKQLKEAIAASRKDGLL
jgi:hypothetical protein